MLHAEQEKQLYQQGKKLLTNPASDIPPEVLAEKLKEIIHYADWKYYVQSEPVFSDSEYDALFRLLKDLESSHPHLADPASPTQRVAKGLSEKFATVSHLVPMLSLENTYDPTDLRNWDKRCREFAGTTQLQYCAEPKYDGASISLIYENGRLFRGTTRGDGIRGEDITANIRMIPSIPLAANFLKEGIEQIEIRGEVVIHKKWFTDFNDQRIREGLPPLANPRNAASGALRMLDPGEVKKRRLSSILYHISDCTMQPGKSLPEPLKTHAASLNLLYHLGFPTPVREMRVCNSIDEVIDYCKAFEEKRDHLPYEVDGIVVKVNDLALQEKMGMTSHHPRWAVAYKFQARQATSKLVRVEFQVGRTGTVTPVAKIEPVHIGGVIVTSVSLFNEDVIREKDLLIGDTVLVERAGDVIPYIVQPMTALRDGSETPIVFPARCPDCQQPLEKLADEAVWRCINVSCPAQVIERLIHFCSKDAMDIRGMGSANIKKFYELGILTDIPSIYRMDWHRVAALKGFGNKSVENLQKAVIDSKQQPLYRILFGLGIRHVGETMAKTLANAVSALEDFFQWSEEDLMELPDVGPKVAASVIDFFRLPGNQAMMSELRKAGLQLEKTDKQEKKGVFSGKTFLFTGTLQKFKRSEAESLVETKGGKILNGVSSKLNFLVVGADAGSKLEKAKKLGTVHILSEDQFLRMVEN